MSASNDRWTALVGFWMLKPLLRPEISLPEFLTAREKSLALVSTIKSLPAAATKAAAWLELYERVQAGNPDVTLQQFVESLRATLTASKASEPVAPTAPAISLPPLTTSVPTQTPTATPQPPPASTEACPFTPSGATAGAVFEWSLPGFPAGESSRQPPTAVADSALLAVSKAAAARPAANPPETDQAVVVGARMAYTLGPTGLQQCVTVARRVDAWHADVIGDDGTETSNVSVAYLQPAEQPYRLGVVPRSGVGALYAWTFPGRQGPTEFLVSVVEVDGQADYEFRFECVWHGERLPVLSAESLESLAELVGSNYADKVVLDVRASAAPTTTAAVETAKKPRKPRKKKEAE